MKKSLKITLATLSLSAISAIAIGSVVSCSNNATLSSTVSNTKKDVKKLLDPNSKQNPTTSTSTKSANEVNNTKSNSTSTTKPTAPAQHQTQVTNNSSKTTQTSPSVQSKPDNSTKSKTQINSNKGTQGISNSTQKINYYPHVVSNPQPVPVISTITESLNQINISEIMQYANVTSLNSYLANYQSASFKKMLSESLFSTDYLTVSNIAYNPSTITSVTVRNNSNYNIKIDSNYGNYISTLSPGQVKSISTSIALIGEFSFVNDNVNLNLTSLWHEKNTGAVDYFNQMWCYNGRAVYDMAAIYGFLSTSINSQSDYNNFDFSNYGLGSTQEITSSSWTTYYDSKYSAQTIQLSWMADILGLNPSGFDGYDVYIQNNSTIVINWVDYQGVWYDVNYTINLGGRFCLNWYFW
ncbi:MAG: hypothetical protein IIT78_00325 [Mycoplasmataceae bacterium]|nr:hypothetical protein [Mycoplasmataceae bacterium]